MKKLLCICMCLVAVASLASASSDKYSTEYLHEYVTAQKEAGTLNPNDPLYLDYISREPQVDHRTPTPRLDQGGSSCATAVVIGSLPFDDTGTLVGETDDCVGRPYFDVFYRYTATTAGSHTFHMCGALSQGDTYLKVWTGGTCCSGASTTGDDNCSIGGADPTVTVTLAVGQVVFAECGYYYADGIGGGGIGTYEFHVSGPPPPTGRCCYGDPCAPTCVQGVTPAECTTLGGSYVAGGTCAGGCPAPLPGDFCCNALPLSVPGTHTGTTVGYTNNGDADCGGTGAPDVIYYYTPTVDQVVTFSNCDVTGYDTKLHLYEGCGTSAILVDCNDDNSCLGATTLRATLSCVPLRAGVTYYLFQDGFSSSSGTYVLNTYVQSSSAPVTIDASVGYPQYACANLCNLDFGQTTVTISGAIRDANMPPVVTVTSGCSPLDSRCNEECTASTNFLVGTWTYGPDGVWTTTIQGEGCVCVCFEGYLAVELNSFSAIAGNNSVTLNWATASENNNDRFEIMRDGNLIGTVPTLGNTSGHSYSWTDNNAVNGRTYGYALVSVDVGGIREELATESATPGVHAGLVTEYSLAQNFPNPFNPTTEISFNILEASVVTLKVYNLVGQEVATLVNGSLEAGAHTVAFDAANLTSGIYLYRLEAGSFSAEKKMVLMK